MIVHSPVSATSLDKGFHGGRDVQVDAMNAEMRRKYHIWCPIRVGKGRNSLVLFCPTIIVMHKRKSKILTLPRLQYSHLQG